jgi:cytochrome c556
LSGNLDKNKNMTAKKIALLLVMIVVLAELPSKLRAQSNTPGENSFKSLHQLMEEGIHERFTYVSYTLWHDTPMTPAKMDTIAESALELRQMAEALPAFGSRYATVDGEKEGQTLFNLKAAELSKVSQKLAETASKRDKKGTETLFKKLEASCQDCHNTFNSTLRNK